MKTTTWTAQICLFLNVFICRSLNKNHLKLNRYRVNHGAPEMTLNRGLCDIAHKLADHLAAENVMEHSSPEQRRCSKGETGENLYYSESTGKLEIDGAPAVDSWYSEIRGYDFAKPDFSMETGMINPSS